MNVCIRCILAGTILAISAHLLPVGVWAQGVAKPEAAPPADGAADSLQKIVEDYNRQLLALDRQRIERLARLAASQEPAAAAATYEELFRLAIEGNLFREAEPSALAIVQKGSPSVATRGLAYLVKLVAECDRGAYEQSLATLRAAVAARAAADQVAPDGPRLLTPEKIELTDAYFQRLIHADQYEVARKAFAFLKENAQDAEFTTWLGNRLRRLELVGKPAPNIQGTDLDGKKFSLAAERDKVVLIVFWASWSLPSAAEVSALREVDSAYRGKGLRIIGVNVDAMQEGLKPELVIPHVRRFLLDRNVTWPSLVNGSGEQDYAKTLGVTEIPANVLVARDGSVAGIDLVPKNLQPTIARVIGQ